MRIPKICTVITTADEAAVKEAEPFTELFEVRIDLVGKGWQNIVGRINKPWIACARCRSEGGSWQGSEAERIEALIRATELGCQMVDIELNTKDLDSVLEIIGKRTKYILSFHDMERTPLLKSLREVAKREIEKGAAVCKVITTARKFQDNLTTLDLITGFPSAQIVSFAMGNFGMLSRVLCPLVGGSFTYASSEEGSASAPGQITAKQLYRIYEMMIK